MKREKRIEEMEMIFDESRIIIDELNKAINKYKNNENRLYKLFNYYESTRWLNDFEAYEKGKIAKDIKVGILSEDAIYDLLIEHSDLLKDLAKIITRALEEKI